MVALTPGDESSDIGYGFGAQRERGLSGEINDLALMGQTDHGHRIQLILQDIWKLQVTNGPNQFLLFVLFELILF